MAEAMGLPEPMNAYELSLAVRYGMRLDELHAGFYRRLSAAFTLTTLLGGSAVFAGFFASAEGVASWAALALAVLTFAEIVVRPGERAALAEASARRFGELRAEAPDLTLDVVRRRLAGLQAEQVAGEVKAFRNVAFGDVMREAGHLDEIEPPTSWERLVAALA